MKKLIIFDLDGTLLNTIGGIGSACNEMLDHFGLPTWKLEDYEQKVGDGSLMLIKRALPPEKAGDEVFLKEAKEVYLKYYRANLARETRPYEGMPELLEELQRRGLTLAVASNKFDDGAKFLVQYFYPQIGWAAVEGQKPGGPLKPEPGIIGDAIAGSVRSAALAAEGLDRTQILYVGDCEIDIQSAERSGLDYVLCTWGFRRRAALVSAGAKALIDTPAELLPYLG